MDQRSRSISNIPLVRGRSTLDLRNKCPSTSKTSARSSSCDKARGRSEIPRLARQRSSSLLRPSKAPYTPSQCSSRSPCTLSSSKKPSLDDKQWRQTSLNKVRRFFEENNCIDVLLIKPGISIDVFIQSINILFNYFEPKLVLTKDNYVKEIPIFLQKLNYHTPIKPSLLRTVNVPHSWPSVLAILTWLVDLASLLIHPDVMLYLPGIDESKKLVSEAIWKCCIDGFKAFNKGEDDTEYFADLKTNIGEALGFDQDEITNAIKLNKHLNNEKNTAVLKLQNKKEEMANVKAKIDDQNQKMKEYLQINNSVMKKLEDAIKKQREENQILDDKIEECIKTKENLKKILSLQKYSLKEKNEIVEEINRIRDTVKCVEERLSNQKEVINSYDFKLTDIKRNVEKLAYDYNNRILELSIKHPELKSFKVPESGFARRGILNELGDIQCRLKDFEKNIEQNYNKRLQELTNNISDLKEKINGKEKECSKLKIIEDNTKLQLKEFEQNYEQEQASLLATIERETEIFTNLEKNDISLDELQMNLKQLEEKCKFLENYKEELSSKGSTFFVQVHDQIIDYFDFCMRTLNSITDKIKEKDLEYKQWEESFQNEMIKKQTEIKANFEKGYAKITSNFEKY